MQFSFGHFDIVRATAYHRAHPFQHVGVPDVALDAVGPDAVHPYRPAPDCRRRQEVGCGRSIAFYQDIARGCIDLAAGHPELAVVVVFHSNAKPPHNVNGHIDVGLGYQVALNVNQQFPLG